MNRHNPHVRAAVALAAAGCLALTGGALAGCGGGEDEGASQGSGDAAVDRAITSAQRVSKGDFPAPAGRSLQEIADGVRRVTAGLATSEYVPGENRIGFGVINNDNRFLYGKSAVYVARGPQQRAFGPYPAPADPLVVDPPFRSQGAALESDAIAAIYNARVPLPKPGVWAVLVVTKTQDGLVGGAANIEVRESSPIPEVGEPAPRVPTETVASAGGNLESIETRVPPDDMHDVNFEDVIGEQPVALIFSTPALCETRVCGPVTDIGAQLQKEYGEEVAFIHQEVYVDNDIQKGLRRPLREFGLRTEPWLFTFDRQGRVAARLEGSFGNTAFEQAVKAALD